MGGVSSRVEQSAPQRGGGSNPTTPLQKKDYRVEEVSLNRCRALVEKHHYAKGGSNTAVACYGLFEVGGDTLLGATWFLPPTKVAAQSVWQNWKAVLSLTRMALTPEAPSNAASFLLSHSVRILKRDDPRWECLVTYADEWQGHTGQIYRAAGWEYMGKTRPSPCWVDSTGKLVARKAGPITRTDAEMRNLGHTLLGHFPKHKYRLMLVRSNDLSVSNGQT